MFRAYILRSPGLLSQALCARLCLRIVNGRNMSTLLRERMRYPDILGGGRWSLLHDRGRSIQSGRSGLGLCLLRILVRQPGLELPEQGLR